MPVNEDLLETIQFDDTLELLPGGLYSNYEKYVQAMWRRFYEGELVQKVADPQKEDTTKCLLMPKRVWQGLLSLLQQCAVVARQPRATCRYQRENRKDASYRTETGGLTKSLPLGCKVA